MIRFSSPPRGVAALLVPLAIAVAGCGGEDPASSGGRLTVIATTDVLADVVGRIAGDAADVSSLIPPGVDPHRFAVSTRDASRLREADIVIANGLGLEAQLGDTLEAVEDDGVPVLYVAEELDPLPAGGDGDDHEGDEEQAEEDGHDHGEFDPHVWLDPLRMVEAARIVADGLAEAEGEGGLTDEEWHERGAAYAEELRAVHDEIVEIVAALPAERRALVTDHDSLRYFAERYGFEVVGTFLPGTSTEAQPSTRAIAELVELVRGRNLRAVFVDATGGTERLAATVVAEAGGDVEVVQVYTGGLGPDGSGAEDLIGLLRTNAARIAEALS